MKWVSRINHNEIKDAKTVSSTEDGLDLLLAKLMTMFRMKESR